MFIGKFCSCMRIAFLDMKIRLMFFFSINVENYQKNKRNV